MGVRLSVVLILSHVFCDVRVAVCVVLPKKGRIFQYLLPNKKVIEVHGNQFLNRFPRVKLATDEDDKLKNASREARKTKLRLTIEL